MNQLKCLIILFAFASCSVGKQTMNNISFAQVYNLKEVKSIRSKTYHATIENGKIKKQNIAEYIAIKSCVGELLF